MSTRLALCDVRGLLNDLLDKLSGEEGEVWKRSLALYLRKENPWPTTIFKHDMTKEDWELLENTDALLVPVANLSPVSFMKDGESYVGGEEMAKRAVELRANLNQRQAEYMLEHQSEIPEELRKYALVFTGTKWRDCVGVCLVPCLYWDGDRWFLNFFWLGNDFIFDFSCRLLRSREPRQQAGE